MRQAKMYLIRFKSQQDGFIGWNSVYAISLSDAKKKLLKRCGQELFDLINWDTLQIGRRAEKTDLILEKAYGGMFD